MNERELPGFVAKIPNLVTQTESRLTWGNRRVWSAIDSGKVAHGGVYRRPLGSRNHRVGGEDG